MITVKKMTDGSRLFDEIELHLMNDNRPSVYLADLFEKNGKHGFPFDRIERLKNTEQPVKYHPEGNVFNHTLLVVDQAAGIKDKSKNPRAFMWAALLHDIGKPDTTKSVNNKITSYDHDKIGAVLAGEFLREFTADDLFISRVTSLIRWHMQILHVTKRAGFANVKDMKKEVDIEELALLGLCDRLGRKNADRKEEERNIKTFLSVSGAGG